MSEEYDEEGIGLLNNAATTNRPNNFMPNYSFSTLQNNNESTELLEQGRSDKSEQFSRTNLIKEKRQTNKKSLLKSIFKRKRNLDDSAPRIIHINNHDLNQQQKFMSNSVSTAKYNVITFLPKFLYEEFSKSANLFFLFISCIQVNIVSSV